jgi:5'-methylthioadenosine phosphorylase
VETPFGPPSDRVVRGRLEGRAVAFLARHGRGHRLLPSELNFRANVFALKALGVERILSVSAVGSLKERYAPLHIVLPDQFVDRTTQRPSTFFGRGLVAHVAFARPICPDLSRTAGEACREAGATFHAGGTYVCIEGPQFSTRAESELFRAWGMDVVGMTNLQEAKLAREAEVCYATLAMVTDYDCWHPDHDSVTVDQVMANLARNSATAKAVLRAALRRLGPRGGACDCAHALAHALVTPADLIPDAVKRELAPLIGKYIS